MTEIRVLAVRQPWASLIIYKVKKLEIRNCKTGYRGKIAIYASKKLPTKREIETLIHYFGELQRECYDELGIIKPERVRDFNYFGSCAAYIHKFYSKEYCKSITGRLIGTVEIVDCKGFSSNIEFEELYDQHFCPSEYVNSSNVCQWILSNPNIFVRPIPFKWPSTGSWSKTELPEAD